MKIWIICWSAIWDIILYIPFFRSLKSIYPNSEIYLITWWLIWTKLLYKCPYIKEIIKITNYKEFIKSYIYINKLWLEILININKLTLATFILNTSALFSKKYWPKQNLVDFIYEKILSFWNSKNQIINFIEWLKVINKDFIINSQPEIFYNIKNVWHEVKWLFNKIKYIVIHLWWKERNIMLDWRNERMRYNKERRSLIIEILKTYNYHLVFIGWKDIINDWNEVLFNINSKYIINFIWKTTIEETVYIIEKSKIFIWTDTWPLHISYACWTKTIWLLNKKTTPPIYCYLSDYIISENMDIKFQEVFNIIIKYL